MASGGGPSVLNVVETNPFRHLNHLSLKFASASDAYLKKYLAECLLGLKVSEYQINLSTFWTICAPSVPFSLIEDHVYSMIHVHVQTMYMRGCHFIPKYDYYTCTCVYRISRYSYVSTTCTCKLRIGVLYAPLVFKLTK